MKRNTLISPCFPFLCAVLLMGPACVLPAAAQQDQPVMEQPPAAAAAPTSEPPAPPQASAPLSQPKEGFWGRVNPFARKKWVNRRLDPMRDRLNELDEVNAKNAQDIKDVDARSQAGIQRAQSSADAANQTAMAANQTATAANGTAQSASGHVNQLHDTVNGLDQYRAVTDVEIKFHGPQPLLSAAARKQLDDLAAGLAGRQGYIVEIEGYAPLAGAAGIQSSNRQNDAVKRYLAVEHQVPVYRMHTVALGNAQSGAQPGEDSQPVRTRSVHVRLMENSLAAQGAAPPHRDDSLTGAERP